MLRLRSSGFALTEVLVAAALLGLGLLGQLALLVTGLQAERAAGSLATATTLASDLGERMRANASAASLYTFDAASAAAPASECALATPFDAATRAACDLDEWRREASAALPGAELEVSATTVAGTTATFCAITIRWQAPGPDRGEYTLQLQVP